MIIGKRGRPLRVSPYVGRYLGFTASQPGARYQTVGVHAAVCEAFHGPRPTPRHNAAHLNGRCTDNRADNLAWVTPKENTAHRTLHGTDGRGQRNHRARLTADQVREIRERRAAGERGVDLALEYGIDQSTVSAVYTQKNWRHV